MKKSDLKDGMVVEYRKSSDGGSRVVSGDRFRFPDGDTSINLCDFSEGLEYTGLASNQSDWDVVKVSQPEKVLWERSLPSEMITIKGKEWSEESIDAALKFKANHS